MSPQRIEIAGQRYVLLPEEEFRELERKARQAEASTLQPQRKRFAEVTPFEITGESASDMLVRERR